MEMNGGPRASARRFSSQGLYWFFPLALLSAGLVTFGIWAFGPEPSFQPITAGLWPEAAKFAVSEPTDRLILLAWWSLPFVLLGIARWGIPFVSSRLRLAKAIFVFLVLVVVGFILYFLMRPPSEGEYWRGVNPLQLSIGIAAVAALAWSWTARRWPFLIVSGAAIAGAVAYLAPTLITTPDRVRDVYHFAFTSEELAAPAAGAFPMGGYTAQYVNLLGYPIAPLLKAAPQAATWIVTSWIVALQILLVLAVVAIVGLIGGRRMIAAALLVVTAPLVLTGEGTPGSALGYFANVPLRTILPVTLILLFLWRLKLHKDGFSRPDSIFIGAFAGLTALNNPEFGLPALLAVLAVMLLIEKSWVLRVKRTLLALVSSLAVALGYLLTLVTLGAKVDVSSYLAFSNIFGRNGFYAVPMEPLGLHVIVVAVFVSATASGIWILLRTGGSRSLLGAGLALSGLWSLLTMSYFAGRSLPPTLVGGVALQMGLVVGVTLPLWRRSIVGAKIMRSVLPRTSALMGIVLIGAFVSMVFLARSPFDALVDSIDARSGKPEITNAAVVESLPTQDSGTLFLLRSGSLTQLELGLNSGMVVNSPRAFMISPELTERQCAALVMRAPRSIVIESVYGEFLARDSTCQELLDFVNPEEIGPDGSVWIVSAK